MGVVLWVAGVAVAYQAAVLAVVWVGWRNARVPHRRDPRGLGLAFETVRIPTAGGKSLHGWWIPAPAPPAADAPCLILVHGWGRNVERMLPWIALLHPAGFDLLAFDARHHGSSDADGYGSLPKFSEDIRAAADFVVRRRSVAPPRGIGVLGLSVGGSAAIHAAALDPRLAAVATVGAFADAADPRATVGPYWWILAPGLPLAFRLIEHHVGVRFRSVSPAAAIARARARFLLIHGTDDTVVPVENVTVLAAAAGERARTWILPGRGHSDLHREKAMGATLAGFFREALGDGRPAPGTAA